MLASLTKSFGALRIQSVLNVSVRAALLATKSSTASAKSPKKLGRAKSKKAPSASSEKTSKELKAKLEKITVPPPPASRCTPFSLFLSENFAKLRKNDMTLVEVVKIAAQKYRELSAAELEALKLRAAAAAKNCAKNYATWAKTLSSAQIAKFNAYLKKEGKRGIVVDPERPKQPSSTFVMFYNDNQELPEYKGLSIAEKARLLGKKWGELSPTLKKKYEDDRAKRSA
ncbi:hypothetical protein L0F63_006432, partial [Massospora cicadina]